MKRGVFTEADMCVSKGRVVFPSVCFFSKALFFLLIHRKECLLCGGLLPLRVDADYTADSSSQADEAVVEADPVEGGDGDGQVADVGDELEAAGESFPERYHMLIFALPRGGGSLKYIWEEEKEKRQKLTLGCACSRQRPPHPCGQSWPRALSAYTAYTAAPPR
jgi:hypothetical protein